MCANLHKAKLSFYGRLEYLLLENMILKMNVLKMYAFTFLAIIGVHALFCVVLHYVSICIWLEAVTFHLQFSPAQTLFA